MKRRVLAAALLLATLAWTAAVGASLQDPATGRTVDLRPGAPVLHLVFFATWCPTCVAELEQLSELEARWSPRGYRQVIVAVQSRHTSERLAAFFAGRASSGQVLFDVNGEAEKTWRARSVPAHLLLDASGKELARSGSLDDSIEGAIERALAVGRRR